MVPIFLSFDINAHNPFILSRIKMEAYTNWNKTFVPNILYDLAITMRAMAMLNRVNFYPLHKMSKSLLQ